MNTIKIYLKASGSIAELYKDFALFKNAYQNNLVDVYVPKEVLYKDQNGTYTNTVKIGGILTADDGSTKTTDSYYLNYLKDEIVGGVEYSVFGRVLPSELVEYAGNHTIVLNVVSIAKEDDKPIVLQVITTQTANMLVQNSAYIGDETIIEPSKEEQIFASITTNQQNIDKLEEETEILKDQVEQNTQDIAVNRNEIDNIKQSLVYKEEFIGNLRVSVLPTDEELNVFVLSEKNREPKSGDVVIIEVIRFGGDTKVYKATYYENGWEKYQITAIQRASNGGLGVVQGTYAIDSENETLIDISGGEILNIYVKDENNNYRNIREYLNSEKRIIDNIISGETAVGNAIRAVGDSLGNNIVATYLTQTLGATKQFVKDYAMPRIFNQVYFITTNGYITTVPTTPESGIQFTRNTNSIGTFELFKLQKETEAQFDLTISNGYENNIFISANKNCQVQFKMTTEYKRSGEDWNYLNIELTSMINLVKDDIQKITFGNPFTSLGDRILTLFEGDLIRQTLEVVTQSSLSTTFNVFSNDEYPSIFSFSTQSYVFQDIKLETGKIIVLGMDGIIESGNVVFEVQNVEDFIEYRTNQRKFLCDMSLPIVGEIDEDLTIRIQYGDTIYNVYSYMEGANNPLTIKDLNSVMKYDVNIGYSYFPELIFIETADVRGFVISPSTIMSKQLMEILSDEGSVIPYENNGKVNFSLSAELTNRLNKALIVPMNAPNSTEIVAIDDTNSQVMLELGESLKIENGKLDVDASLTGTRVTVGGVTQTTFNADTKVNVSTFNNLNQEVQDLKTDVTGNMTDISSLQADVTELNQEMAKTLKTPMSAPNTTELVGVDSSNSQVMIKIDSALSTTSENPVQNKAITNAVNMNMLGVPSNNNWVNISISQNETYGTAPANGWVLVRGSSRDSNAWGTIYSYVGNGNAGERKIQSTCYNSINDNFWSVCIPVKKGDLYKIHMERLGFIEYSAHFVPAEEV